MTSLRLSNVTYRFFSISLLGMVVAFGVLIILPFFAFGLNHEPPQFVVGGAYDPKGFPFFQTTVGGLARLAGMFTLAFAPFWVAIFGIIFLFGALVAWRRWNREHRAVALVSLAASLMMLLFIFSEVGQVITRWYAD